MSAPYLVTFYLYPNSSVLWVPACECPLFDHFLSSLLSTHLLFYSHILTPLSSRDTIVQLSLVQENISLNPELDFGSGSQIFINLNLNLQLLKKLSQCFAILERLTWHKSNKLSNILKIIYVIV